MQKQSEMSRERVLSGAGGEPALILTGGCIRNGCKFELRFICLIVLVEYVCWIALESPRITRALKRKI